MYIVCQNLGLITCHEARALTAQCTGWVTGIVEGT